MSFFMTFNLTNQRSMYDEDIRITTTSLGFLEDSCNSEQPNQVCPFRSKCKESNVPSPVLPQKKDAWDYTIRL